jgi:DNA-binding transcriptional LysR family regulator
MHIENFKVFADLVATKSFSKAGKLNGISQSAVSQQLRAMEAYIGAPAIDRSQKRLLLTREGETLFAAAREIAASHDRALSEIKALRGRVDGTIRLSTVHSIGLYELPEVLKRYLAEHPNVNFRIEYRRHNFVLDDVEHSAADFGLVAYPAADYENLVAIPFAEDCLVAVCAPEHPFAKRRSITFADLAGENFINYDRDIPTRKAVDRVCAAKRVALRNVMELDNVETIKRAVEVGVGLALVPAASVRQEFVRGTLVVVRLKDCFINRPLAVLHRRGFALTPAMKLFVDLMSLSSETTAGAQALFAGKVPAEDAGGAGATLANPPPAPLPEPPPAPPATQFSRNTARTRANQKHTTNERKHR